MGPLIRLLRLYGRWKFYASVDMSPTNNIWRGCSGIFDYITMSEFSADGETRAGRTALMFDIHVKFKACPVFIDAVHRIYNAGYDLDYISDNFIRSTYLYGWKLVTSGGTTYRALLIPGAKRCRDDVLAKLFRL